MVPGLIDVSPEQAEEYPEHAGVTPGPPDVLPERSCAGQERSDVLPEKPDGDPERVDELREAKNAGFFVHSKPPLEKARRHFAQ